ncbi:MAG: FGGY-family carbohydrate kinase [Treponema sp.]|nr:FGGY-family carbohydrate kinase [Treponema sp.]
MTFMDVLNNPALPFLIDIKPFFGYHITVLLTIDIGTSVYKTALWDFEGNRKAFASVPLPISLSHGLCHEADSSLWLRAFADCCQNLGAAFPLAAVEAVVISGNGPSLTPVLGPPEVNAKGLHLPAAPARLWLDRRAADAAQQVSAFVGGFVDASFFLPKALDIKTNEPQLYEKTQYFLGCPEFLAFALTGEARIVFPSDGFDRWFWNDSVLAHFGLDKEKFPRFIRPGETFGALAPQAAARFGLKPGIPVVAGGPDFFAAILGAGVVNPGQVCDRAGTSEGINACTETCITDKRLMCYGHPVKPFWNLSGIISTTGKAVEWARDFLGLTAYDAFTALAQNAQAGSGGLVFLPYLAGERSPVWNPSARGVLRGLTLSTGQPEFARSVLEGIGFAIRDVISVMEESGAIIDALHVAGAASASGILNQIKADITGKPVHALRQKEAELLGLAIIGACALRKYTSFTESARALVHIEKTWLPNENNAALYDDLFGEYRVLQNAIPNLSDW